MSVLPVNRIMSGEVGQFARLLQAYKGCSPEIRALVDEMCAIVADAGSTEDDREHASDAILEALMPGLTDEVVECHSRMIAGEGGMLADREIAAEQCAFADRVRAALRKSALAPTSLAERVGIAPSEMDSILAGHNRPGRRTVARIATALGMRADELWPQ